MTYDQAVSKAKDETRRAEEVRYVVVEFGEFHVASDEEMETFFCGMRDERILFCTA